MQKSWIGAARRESVQPGFWWVQSAFTFSNYKCVLFKPRMLLSSTGSFFQPLHEGHFTCSAAASSGKWALQGFKVSKVSPAPILREKPLNSLTWAFCCVCLNSLPSHCSEGLPSGLVLLYAEAFRACSRLRLFCLSFSLYYFGVTLFVFPLSGCVFYNLLRVNAYLIVWLLVCI